MQAIDSDQKLLAVAQTILLRGQSKVRATPCLSVTEHLLAEVRREILNGTDPLGEAYTRLRAQHERRQIGAVYTPKALVDRMIEWSAREGVPNRVVDAGAGTGRFVMAAAHRFPKARLIAVEADFDAVLLLRANLEVVGLTERVTVLSGDYRFVALPSTKGATLFIGNPPYVRHHALDAHGKDWFAQQALLLGVKASKLSGLHVHFFIKTLRLAKPGDYGCFVTSAEWLDVNYGSVVRQLLADGLGGCSLDVFDPQATPFAGTLTTGAVVGFKVGRRPSHLRVRSIQSAEKINALGTGRAIPWKRVSQMDRWSLLVRQSPKPPADFIELGELFRVHRGQVTGNNNLWIAGVHSAALPSSVLFPCVTKAKEIIDAAPRLVEANRLRRVISLPKDLDELNAIERRAAEAFLRWAKIHGGDASYIAQHRTPWWSVDFRAPAPILSTYMARKPPTFVRNLCDARHLNIAHGLYPRQMLPDKTLNALVRFFSKPIHTGGARVYAGGLIKFEPRELERVFIPNLQLLTA